jgi:enoyl-CoA hydratase/carnithine racemase
MKLVYSAEGGVGRIELRNPPHNSLVSPAFEDPARLAAFLARDDLKAAIVVGHGRHFSTGADLDDLAARISGDTAAFGALLAAGKSALDAIRYSEIPVVAAIRGSCLGAGLEIALACHFRVASANALLGFPEAERGLMPGLGGTLVGGVRAPRGAVIELLLSGRMIRGEEAVSLGLVDAAVPTADVASRAEDLVGRLVAGRTRSQIRRVMTAVHNAERLPRDEALAAETRLFVELAAEVGARGAGGGR